MLSARLLEAAVENCLEPTLLTLDANKVAAALPYDQLIDALRVAFRGDYQVPLRSHQDVALPDGNPGTLLLMPAWKVGNSIGIKIATVFPDNAQQSLPAVFASYVLLSATTGEPTAFMDGTELTLRRTAAASALASSYLSRAEASTLLMVGTGNLAPHLVRAHASARPITDVLVWGRRREAAEKLCDQLGSSSLSVTVADDLEQAVAQADIISCATLASEPLIQGKWLKPGQHVDLVGAFKPEMREADSEAVARSEVYVDTKSGALAEAGDIVQAINDGSIKEADIRGELRDLVSTDRPARTSDKSITLFKSVGTAIEDLAAAELAVRNRG